MNRHSVRLIAAAFAVAGLAGCFDDPTSSLRNGPDVLSLSRTAVAVTFGDSVQVEAFVRDEQGNALPTTGATWTTDNATVAAVNLSATQTPSDGSTRAYVRATNAAGAVTYVRISVRGLADSVRVASLPSALPTGLASVTGTPRTDTLPAGVYTAGDTVVINSGATLEFDSSNTAVRFGANPAYVIVRSATQFKVMSRGPYRGPVTVTRITFFGTPTTGEITFDSLFTADTVEVARARFTGTAAVAASAFGPGTQLTVTAPTGMTFSTAGTLTTVQLGTAQATVLARTAASITAIAIANYTGPVRVNNALVGGVRIDSLYTTTAATIGAAFFPGTVVNGAGNLLDTIKVIGGASADFTITGAAAGQSSVTFGGQSAFIIRRAADTLYAIARKGATGAVTVSNVIITGVTAAIPSLTSQGTITASTAATGEVNEPGNQASATATPITLTSANTTASPVIIYGSMDAVADARDYYTIAAMPALAAGGNAALKVTLEFLGGGSGADDDNPDEDVVVCTALSGTGSCSYGQDIIPGNAASNVVQPETGTTTAITAGAQVWVRTFALFATAAGPATPYKLTLNIQ